MSFLSSIAYNFFIVVTLTCIYVYSVAKFGSINFGTIIMQLAIGVVFFRAYYIIPDIFSV